MAPVALVERRVAQHDVGPEAVVRVRPDAVARGGADDRAAVQGEPQCGERREFGGGVLAVQGLLGRGGDGAQQGAGAAGGVQGGAGGPGQLGHQGGEAGRGERVLARARVQVPAEQELVRLPGAQFGGEVDGGAQQRGGRAQRGGVGDADGGGAQGAEAGGEHLFEVAGQEAGEPVVGAGGDLQPDGGPGVNEQQDAAGVQEAGDGALRVAGELLPDPLAQRDLGEFSLAAQPFLDLGEGEGGAGLGAADGLGEVRVTAAPVADGGAADTREPRDTGGGHLCGVVLHETPTLLGLRPSVAPMIPTRP